MEQRRGRGDSMHSIRRALKSMFNRGKKNEPQQQSQPTSSPPTPVAAGKATPQQRQSPQPPTPPAKDVPKKDETTAAGQSEVTIKDMPPTYRLATNEAVSQDHTAKPGPPAPAPAVASGGEGLEKTKEEHHTVSAVSSVPQKAEEKQMSAIRNDVPATPAKEDASAAAVRAAPSDAAAAASAVNDQVTRIESTGEKSTTQDTSAAQATKKNEQPVSNGTALAQLLQDVDDDKKPDACRKQPPIEAVQVAPRMSATSGPLEDFPEGG